MHHSLHDDGILQHHNGAQQVVVPFRELLESPKMGSVPVPCLAVVDDIDQHVI